MKLIKVGGAELNQTPMDWDKNRDNILAALQKAQKECVSILCLPELCISGYGCEDMFYSENVLSNSLRCLFEILPYTKGMVICVGLPLMYRNRTFNTSCLMVDGQIQGFVAKRFLARNGIHYEPRWFTPWPENEQTQVPIKHPNGEEKNYPLGDLFFDIGGLKIGFEICEDAWVANRPGRKLYEYGVDLILNPSASHFAFGKFELRKRFVLEGSRAFGTGYIYANLLGNEAGRAIYDGGTLIAASGELAAEGERLTFDDYRVTTATLDFGLTRMTQAQASSAFNIPKDVVGGVKIDFDFPEATPDPKVLRLGYWEKSDTLQEEEFMRAEALGLFDYLRKSYSQGFVVSLSGGADSAAVAVLCYLMVRLGIVSIGLQAFKEKLGHITKIQKLKTADDIANALILTAYQSTENSSLTTKRAARELASGINSTHHEITVNQNFKQYVKIVEKALGRDLAWETDDIALQNIQSRVRAPSIWMFTNITGSLLLSTSNRSEAAVGYATMDGDTSGGLSPIAGIDKHFLRQWLRWIEKNKRYGIRQLRYVNQQQPTAELRPESANQTDEDDLMPYDVLDYIEEAAIRDKKSPRECLALLRMKYPKTDDKDLKSWIRRFFQLWSRNQWKRERYAPSFHLDDKNLDPKTWCRFPILSGGYRRELAEL